MKPKYHSPDRRQVRAAAINASAFVHVVQPINVERLTRRYKRALRSILGPKGLKCMPEEAKDIAKTDQAKRFAKVLGGPECIKLAADVIVYERELAALHPAQQRTIRSITTPKPYRKPVRSPAGHGRAYGAEANGAAAMVQP